MSGHARDIRTPDEWRDVAQSIAQRVTNGPGSTHARVMWIRDQIIAIAAENYEAGKRDALEDVKRGAEMVMERAEIEKSHIHMNSDAPPIIEDQG